jgi:uncharacterized SAM-binding protein YcdF (DUF218 family)
MMRRVILSIPLAAVLVLGAGFLWFVGEARALPEQPLIHTDGIAVLTGGAERVETGLRLLAAGEARVLLVTGVYREASLSEVLAAGGFDDAGPLASHITLGRQATSTRGNATEIAAWVAAEHLSSLRLVTSGYHMPRARLEVGRVLSSEVRIVPHPVQVRRAGDSQVRRWSLLATEYGKWLAVKVGMSALVPLHSDVRAL